jgi:putative ABC transport system permease protein
MLARLRRLWSARGFTLPVTATLALGLGLAGAAYVLLDQLWWRPLAVRAPEQLLVAVYRHDGGTPQVLSGRQAERMAALARDFGDVSVLADPGTTSAVAIGERSALVSSVRVDGAFARTVGIDLVAGRDAASPGEAVLGADVLAAIGVAADAAIGAVVRVNGEPVTVVGVLPTRTGHVPEIDLVLPMDVQERARMDGGQNTWMYLRTPDAARRAAAVAALDEAGARMRADDATLISERGSIEMRDAGEVLSGRLSTRTVSLGQLLAGVVLAMLVLMTGTLAIVAIARGAHQRSEWSVRSALGAAPTRLLRERFVEGLMLYVPALLLGLLLCAAVLGWMRSGLAQLGRVDELMLDARGVVTIAVAGLLVVALGVVVPALAAATIAPGPLGLRGAVGSGRWQRVLVVAQIAFCFALMCGFALLAFGLQRLLSENPGFRSEGVLAASLPLTSAPYRDPASARRTTTHLLDRLQEDLRALPGVRAVATASSRPMERGLNNFAVVAGPDGDDGASVEVRAIGGDYFRILGLQLLRGEALEGAGSDAVVVNAAFAQRFFADQDAVGRSLTLGGGPARVVGIVGDVRDVGYDTAAIPTVYLSRDAVSSGLQAMMNHWFSIAVLIDAAPGALDARRLDATLRALDPDLAWRDQRRLDDVMAASTAGARFLAQAMAMLAVVAAALAGFGLFAALRFLQAARRREIAMRMALGARSIQLAGLVSRQVGLWTASGIAIGLALVLAARRAVEALAYQSTVLSPWVLLTALGVVVAVVVAATWMPLRDALRLAPNEALRE